MSEEKFTTRPLRAVGPSPGGTPWDDGGDYGIVDKNNYIIAQFYRKLDYGAEVDAEANAARYLAERAACAELSTVGLQEGMLMQLIDNIEVLIPFRKKGETAEQREAWRKIYIALSVLFPER